MEISDFVSTKTIFREKNIPMRVIVKELKKLAHGRIPKVYNEDIYGHYHYTWQMFSLYLLILLCN
jgi:hypothetical protein